MTYRTPAQAIEYASTHLVTAKGYCQKECRIAYGVPTDGTRSAAADWFKSKFRHPLKGDSPKDLLDVPVGAILRWTGGSSGSGHVALYAGKGMMWSTDLPVNSRRGLVPVSLARTRWGLRFVGWTEDIDGVRVCPMPVPKRSPVPLPPVPVAPPPSVIHAAQKRRVFHDDHRIRTGGGVVSDSVKAAALAAAKHYHWIDSDVEITHMTKAGAALRTKDMHMVPVNAHGAPFNPAWLGKRRFQDVSLEEHNMLLFSSTLRRNAQHGLSTEIEVKDWRPYVGPDRLDTLFEELAREARAAYGPGWRDHAVVKVLTNLSGGIEYALKVAHAANLRGFRVMILARGKWRYTRLPASANADVSWVRGARPGLYPRG